MKNEQVYLKQIIDCLEKIREFTNGMEYQQFSEDQKTQSAVIMQLALIGELAKKISKETQAKVAIPWKEIAGFRDRAIHDYYQIDIEIVWETVENDLTLLKETINDFLTS